MWPTWEAQGRSSDPYFIARIIYLPQKLCPMLFCIVSIVLNICV